MRKVCVVTGNRAEYGLLQWLMRAIAADARLELRTVVTGAHLVPQFGLTRAEIDADGFAIDAEVPMQVAGDDGIAAAKSIGLGIIGMADALARLAPDLVVVLGDRYEILAVAQAALMLGLPLAHLHGGELTEGAVDDAIRHAITKMASLHFVAHPVYARRVIQLGESPGRVFDVGALGVEAALKLPRLSRAELEADLGLGLAAPLLLVTYHPATRGTVDPGEAASRLTVALDGHPRASVVITGVNPDPGYNRVAAVLADWVKANSHRARLVQSLGQRRYLSVMALADAVVGNSSSGLLEAPAMRRPTVNIGNRQGGRLRAPSVIDCPENSEAIVAAIGYALSPAVRETARSMPAFLGDGETASRVAGILASVDLGSLKGKVFHDL